MRVLIIDDSESIRRRLRELLGEARGVEVHEAGDRALALELCAKASVDAILLDIALVPRVRLDLIQTLKSCAPRALVIVLTNNASEAHRRACLRCGADHFFDKSRQFERAVDIALRHGGTRRIFHPSSRGLES